MGKNNKKNGEKLGNVPLLPTRGWESGYAPDRGREKMRSCFFPTPRLYNTYGYKVTQHWKKNPFMQNVNKNMFYWYVKQVSMQLNDTIFTIPFGLAFYLFIFMLRPQLVQVTYSRDEPLLFWLRGKPRRPPIWAPCLDKKKKKWNRFWDLSCISVGWVLKLQANELIYNLTQAFLCEHQLHLTFQALHKFAK